MTMPSTIGAMTPLLATDEYIATLCYGDFAVLTPGSNLMASGTDGVFQSTDLWTLTSATNDFAALGVVVGHIVRLEGGAPQNPAFKGSGQFFAVGSVATGRVTLRRVGQGDGKGLPPSPAGGLAAVKFTVATLNPQIEDVTFDLYRQFGIDPKIAPRSPTWVYDLRDLQELCGLTVLYRQYLADTRTKEGDFAFKVRDFRERMEKAGRRCQVRWGPNGNNQAPISVFGTKIVR